MNKAQWFSLGRDVLRVGGAYLATKGYVDNDSLATIETLIGIAAVAAGSTAGVVSNSTKRTKKRAAKAKP